MHHLQIESVLNFQNLLGGMPPRGLSSHTPTSKQYLYWTQKDTSSAKVKSHFSSFQLPTEIQLLCITLPPPPTKFGNPHPLQNLAPPPPSPWESYPSKRNTAISGTPQTFFSILFHPPPPLPPGTMKSVSSKCPHIGQETQVQM